MTATIRVINPDGTKRNLGDVLLVLPRQPQKAWTDCKYSIWDAVHDCPRSIAAVVLVGGRGVRGEIIQIPQQPNSAHIRVQGPVTEAQAILEMWDTALRYCGIRSVSPRRLKWQQRWQWVNAFRNNWREKGNKKHHMVLTTVVNGNVTPLRIECGRAYGTLTSTWAEYGGTTATVDIQGPDKGDVERTFHWACSKAGVQKVRIVSTRRSLRIRDKLQDWRKKRKPELEMDMADVSFILAGLISAWRLYRWLKSPPPRPR